MNELQILANKNRRAIIEMIYNAKAGHPGGSLSIIDILTTIYEKYVEFDNVERSRVILSKGHASPAQYACLYSKGIIEKEELKTFRRIDSRLQGHPHTLSLPEVDATTGLLGQGLSIGIGQAFGKILKNQENKVFVVVGDGELHEGQIWESLLIAAHYKLENLVLIVDYNQLSSSGDVNNVINLNPLMEKFESFNWNTMKIDGHNYKDINKMLKRIDSNKGAPLVVVAKTIKGKGISFMENNPRWHSGAISESEYEICRKELGD